MRTTILRSGSLGRLLLPSLLGAVALTACGDQQPVGARRAEPAGAGRALAAFDCEASVTGGVSCRPAGADASGASRAIIGGQGTNIQLSSSNASYDAGTQTFSVDVTVQNLLNEALGSADGVTPDVDGIQVFFQDEPSVATGTGSVSVANADGTGFFTAANQPFHRYSEILDTNEVSATKPWLFTVSPTVTSFRFSVLVEADVEYALVINEVLVNPQNPLLDANAEWFEIFNAGSLPVELEGLVIADSAASGRRPYHRIASSVVVPSGGYVVLGNTTNTTTNGGVTVDYAYGNALQFANSLDAVKVARVVGTDTLTLDRTQYSAPGTSAVDGVSRELINPSLDNSNMDGSNWASALSTAVFGPGGRGTPKAQNSTFTP